MPDNPKARAISQGIEKNKDFHINEFVKTSQNDIFKKRNIAPLRKVSSSCLREQLTFAAVVLYT